MSRWLVSSVQQYTLNMLRISFSTEYSVENLKKLTFALFAPDSTDVTDKLLSINESNDWRYTESTDSCDIVLNKETFLTEGIYTFKLYENNSVVYESSISLNYMEDIRTTFSSIELESLDTLVVKFSSLYDEGIYQTRKMLSLMNFSCIDESGVSYSDVFESFGDIINSIPVEDDPITEVHIPLKQGRVLPKGCYTVRLTSRYKSRTFSILESEYSINFMTTTPPTITSSTIVNKSDGSYVLNVTFGSYIEKSMLDSATRSIIRSDGKNISSYFSADRVSTTTISTAGVSYIARLEIPLISEFYVLQKGKYIIKYSFPYDYVDDISSEINTDWCLKAIPKTELTNLEYLTFRFPETVFYSDAVNLKYMIEIDGTTITDPSIIDAFSEIEFNNPNESPVEFLPDQVINRFYIRINNKRHIKSGQYAFIFYYEISEIEYKYIAYFDFKHALTPKVTNIYQSDIDHLTVELSQQLPIEVVEYCKMSLFDEYGGIDFSSRLESIHDSNIWEPGEITTDRFNVMISNGTQLSSGKYVADLIFGDVVSDKFVVTISYMETRKGIIHDVEQVDLSHIVIHFSESQTRRFLLSTSFSVERIIDGADFTDRFELLENVIKADQYVISDLIMPMNHDESLPAGRYRISFLWKTSNVDTVVVYSIDTELGYMTSSLPEISTTSTFIDSDGLLNLRIQFGSYLELDLFNQATVSLIDSNDSNIISKMAPKDEWALVTTSKKNITTIKNITMKARNKTLTFEKDSYHIIFSWDDVIKYMNDVSSSVDIDYILPLTVVSEVVALDTTKSTGRLYFEFDKVLQYTFFENLKVKAFDENGNDQTSAFDTIQHSNNIGPDTPESQKVPTNNINLNILNINELSFGSYTFIFYHENAGVQSSEYKSFVDIMAAISPSIKDMEQVGIDTILVNLKASVPRMILETDTFQFISFKNYDYTNYFKSIDESNNWDESLREVSSFYIKLKNGYRLTKGSYSFTMYAGHLRLDQCDIELDYMEGADISIEKVELVNLSTLSITFSEEQSVTLFKSLDLQIVNENGTDISYKFNELADSIKAIKTDYFETLQISILDGYSIPSGDYTINIIKENDTSEDSVVMSEIVPLKYMSYEYPLLYEVIAAKLVNKNDGIVMTFKPALELDLFANSGFTFNNVSGMSVLDKFEPISDASLNTFEENGITYIDTVTLEFDPAKTLNKDKYIIGFNWIGDYSYMKNLTCEVSLDYILFPVKSVELVSSDTVELVFNSFLKNSYLKNTELVVRSIYQTKNEDGTVITDVDFTDQFKELTDTNDFEHLPEDINKLTFQLNENRTLPEANYRFIIAERIQAGAGTTLQYAYAGTLSIEILISKDILESTAVVTQTSYDTLKMKFSIPQNVRFLNQCEMNIVRTDVDQLMNFTTMFKSVKESNRYDILDDNGNITGYDYYIDGMNRDNVIDEIHYTVKEANFIYLKLNTNCAIPSGSYTVCFTCDGNQYFKSSFDTTFMTQNPPKISQMDLTDGNLDVKFNPYTEITTACQSMFNLMTNKGFDSDGNIVGDDITSSFNPVMMSEMHKIDSDIGITYVDEIKIPYSPDILIASGRYRLTWNWGTGSFLPDSVFDGSFNVVAKGIKSAITHNFNTIKVTLENEYAWSYIKNLDINVINSLKEDCSDLFQTIEESNPSMKDDDKVDSFYIMVEDGEVVASEMYTFTLSYHLTDTDGETSTTEAFTFMMNIVYLADEFPNISIIDNLSSQIYTIESLSSSNISSYYGRYVQLLDDDAKVVLSKSNSSEFINQYVKIFENPSIDKLTIRLDKEVHPCLLNALEHTLLDDEGNNISNYFDSIKSSNVFKARKILNVIKFTFKRYVVANTINNYDISITTVDGEDISNKFLSFWDSNPTLNEDSVINSFVLKVDNDEIIEALDSENLKIIMTDDETRITGYSFNMEYRNTNLTNEFNMKLASNTTLAPGAYNLQLSYQNEPLLEDAVTITPWTYDEELPFLSTMVGNITSIEATDLAHIDIRFSEDLPTSIFGNMVLHVYNEDNEDVGDKFESIETSTDLSEGPTLSELNKPYTITLCLADDSYISAGLYTFVFDMKISANDDEENPNSDYYTLWSSSTNLAYMTNEKPNTLTSVVMNKINTLKVSLQNPVDSSFIRNLKISLENDSTGYQYSSDAFMSLSESNNFGKYVLLTDKTYLLVSDDCASWTRFNTGKNYSFNDILTDTEKGINIIVCSGGKVLVFDKLTKESFKEFDTPTTKNLTSIIKVGNGYIITGNDGIIIKGIYNNNNFTWMTCATNTNKTITRVAKKSETELVAVGYNGTILYSKDAGSTWTTIHAAISSPAPNLTDVIYYESYTDSTGEISTPENPGFYITGTNGTILYSLDGSGFYEKISVGTSSSFYSISQHGGNLIAVGDSGTIYSTRDTEDWTKIETTASYSLKKIEWCDNKFIICGSSGKWLTSISGDYWTQFSSVTSDTIKNAKFLDSQYKDNRNVDYFYIQLNTGYSIGTVNFYTGTYEPDLTNSPAKQWLSGDTKRTHVGDIFTQFATDGDTSVIVAEYQFSADKLYDGDDEATIFSWKNCTSASSQLRFSGEYTMFIYTNDANETLWNQKESINLTYLTSNPGDLISVTVNNPSSESSNKYVEPYIHVKMDMGDEEAIYYSSYEITDINGNDFTNRFLSLHASDLSYSSALKIDGVNIPRATSTVYPPVGSYTFKWKWTTSDIISVPFTIKSMSNLINNIHTSTDPSALVIEFSKPIDTKYFYDVDSRTGMNTSEAQILIYKKSGETIDTSYNYFSVFKLLEQSTVFTSSTVNRVTIALESGNILAPGSYQVAIRNAKYSLDDAMNMYVLSSEICLEQELCTTLPSIAIAKLADFKQSVEPLVKGKITTRYSGYASPSENSDMIELLQSWTFMNELDYHVGDIYTNSSTNQNYIFNVDKITGEYSWEPDVTNACLCVSFGDKPLLQTSLRYVNGIKLTTSSNSDVTSYIDSDPNSWTYETSSIGGTTYVSKIAMEVDKTQNFFGASDVQLDLTWKAGCIYDNLSYSGIDLPACIASYGNIKKVYAQSIPDIDTTKGNGSHCLAITFTQPVLTSMLSSALFEISYRSGKYAEVGDDFTDCFMSIKDSNSELFETDASTKTTKKIYVLLNNGKSIPSGIYDVKLRMTKPSSDIGSSDNEVLFTGLTSSLPWLTYEKPFDITVSFVKKEPFRMPVLKISFVDRLPAYSSCTQKIPKSKKYNSFKIKVTRQSTGTDYSNAFVNTSTSNAIEYVTSKEDPSLVETIYVPMRQARALPAGDYDVSLSFPSYAKLSTVPGKDSGIHRTFKVSKNLISTIGKVKVFHSSTNQQKLEVTVELYPELATNAKFKSSQIAKVYKIKSINALLKKLSLKFEYEDETDYTNVFIVKPTISGRTLTYTLKNDHVLNPGGYCAYFTFNGYEMVERRAQVGFRGLIKNVSGKGQKDSTCYILVESHGSGKPRWKVYSRYAYITERITKLEKINEKQRAQLAKCLECRSNILLSTSTISATFDKYDFPGNATGDSVGYLLKHFYKKIIAKEVGCKNPDFRQIISDDEVHYQCQNYMNQLDDYEWEVYIASKPKSTKLALNGDKASKVDIAYLDVDGTRLYRVYASTKKGKKTKKFKAYIETLKSYIASYKKKAAKCNKCKKREISSKSKSTITWTNARFNIKENSNTTFLNKFTKAFSNKKVGCSKAKFKFNDLNANQCQVTCANYKKSKSMDYGSTKGTFMK